MMAQISLLWTLLLLAVASAQSNTTASANQTITSEVVTTSTQIVTEYTTYCPEPTTFIEGNKTYTADGPTTITVTDCPCTRTHTITTQFVTVCATDQPVVAPSASTSIQLSNGAARNGFSLALAGAVAIVLL